MEKEKYVKQRTETSMQLYRTLLKKGYDEAFCNLISQNLNTDFTARRMLGYLAYYDHLPEVEIVDEMLAILSDRDVFIRKKEAEEAQEKLNELYRNGFGLDEE